MFIRAVLNFSGFIRAKKYNYRAKKGVNQKNSFCKEVPYSWPSNPSRNISDAKYFKF